MTDDEALPIDRLETHVQRHVQASHEVMGLIKQLSAFVIGHLDALPAEEVEQLQNIVVQLDRQLDNMSESIGDIGGDIVGINKYYADILTGIVNVK